MGAVNGGSKKVGEGDDGVAHQMLHLARKVTDHSRRTCAHMTRQPGGTSGELLKGTDIEDEQDWLQGGRKPVGRGAAPWRGGLG